MKCLSTATLALTMLMRNAPISSSLKVFEQRRDGIAHFVWRRRPYWDFEEMRKQWTEHTRSAGIMRSRGNGQARRWSRSKRRISNPGISLWTGNDRTLTRHAWSRDWSRFQNVFSSSSNWRTEIDVRKERWRRLSRGRRQRRSKSSYWIQSATIRNKPTSLVLWKNNQSRQSSGLIEKRG